MDRKSLIKEINRCLNDDIVLCDSRQSLMLRLAMDRGVEDKLISASERTNFLNTLRISQAKLLSKPILDKLGRPETKVVLNKKGEKVSVPLTIADLLEYDKDAYGNRIPGTNRIGKNLLALTYSDGTSRPKEVDTLPSISKQYDAYRAEMRKNHNEKLARDQDSIPVPKQNTGVAVPTQTTAGSQYSHYPTPDPLTWLLLLLVGALSGLIAMRKGYNFYCWMFAAAGSMLVCFLILPFMKDVNNEPAEDRERLIRVGNITGIVLSCAYPVIVMLLGLGLAASGK